MIDASRVVMGVILVQRKEGKLTMIHYTSRTLNEVQMNYATTEKQLLSIVFAFQKFQTYLLGYKTIVYTNHAAIRFLFDKKKFKPWIMRWILLLQEFDLEIKDKKILENTIPREVIQHEARVMEYSLMSSWWK